MTLCRQPRPDEVCETRNESIWKHCPENFQGNLNIIVQYDGQYESADQRPSWFSN